MKTTRYVDEQVLRKRPYVEMAWCEAALTAPLRRDVQPDGRVRLWTRVRLPGEDSERLLRVVVLEDGVTVHNAFLDRGFSEAS